jgi:hypothetical protein
VAFATLSARAHQPRLVLFHVLYVPGFYFPHLILRPFVNMSETELVAAQGTTATTSTTAVVKKEKKLKPARKQVKPGEVEKKEAVQTGKEYSTCLVPSVLLCDCMLSVVLC